MLSRKIVLTLVALCLMPLGCDCGTKVAKQDGGLTTADSSVDSAVADIGAADQLVRDRWTGDPLPVDGAAPDTGPDIWAGADRNVADVLADVTTAPDTMAFDAVPRTDAASAFTDAVAIDATVLRDAGDQADGTTYDTAQPDSGVEDAGAVTRTYRHRYSIAEIGLLYPEYEGYSRAYGINDSGVVVGYAYFYSGQDYGRAFLWDGQTLTDLGTVSGGNSYGQGISASGLVRGYQDTPHVSWIWDSTDGYQEVSTYTGTEGVNTIRSIQDINASDTMVAEWGSTSEKVCLWDSTNGKQDIEMTGYHSYAKAINDLGQVTGGSDVGDYGTPRHAYLASLADGVLDIGTLDGRRSSSGEDINNNGAIVGNSWDRDASSGWNYYNQHAFYWHPQTGMLDMGTLEGGQSFAHAINDDGVAVGRALEGIHTDRTRAFVWHRENGLWDLLDLVVDGEDWQRLAVAEDINAHGVIVGWGYTSVQGRGFVLTPVMEVQSDGPHLRTTTLGSTLTFEHLWKTGQELTGQQSCVLVVQSRQGAGTWQDLAQITVSLPATGWQSASVNVEAALQGEAQLQFRLAQDYPAVEPAVYLRSITSP